MKTSPSSIYEVDCCQDSISSSGPVDTRAAALLGKAPAAAGMRPLAAGMRCQAAAVGMRTGSPAAAAAARRGMTGSGLAARRSSHLLGSRRTGEARARR